MKILLIVIISAFELSMTLGPWRDVMPGKSTCRDVERIFGGTACGKKSAYYETASQIVTIQFAEKPCHKLWPYEDYGFRRGTVTDVIIIPRITLKVSELGLDLSSFEKMPAGDMIGASELNSHEMGISLTVSNNGEIMDLHLFPGAEFDIQRCFPKRKALEDEATVYGALPILVAEYNPGDSRQKIRALRHTADRLADIEASESKSSNAALVYVIAYSAPDLRPELANQRAEAVRDFLTLEYGVTGSKVITINGGYKSKSQVQLFVRPAGASAPQPNPTVYPPNRH